MTDCPDHHQPRQQAEARHAAQVRGRPQEALREGRGRAPRLLDGRRQQQRGQQPGKAARAGHAQEPVSSQATATSKIQHCLHAVIEVSVYIPILSYAF